MTQNITFTFLRGAKAGVHAREYGYLHVTDDQSSQDDLIIINADTVGLRHNTEHGGTNITFADGTLAGETVFISDSVDAIRDAIARDCYYSTKGANDFVFAPESPS